MSSYNISCMSECLTVTPLHTKHPQITCQLAKHPQITCQNISTDVIQCHLLALHSEQFNFLNYFPRLCFAECIRWRMSCRFFFQIIVSSQNLKKSLAQLKNGFEQVLIDKKNPPSKCWHRCNTVSSD